MHWVFYVCLSPRHKLASISTFAWKLNSEMANPAGKGLLIVKACCKPRSYTHWAESAIEMKHLRQFGTRRLNPGSSSAFNPLINKGLRFRDSAGLWLAGCMVTRGFVSMHGNLLCDSAFDPRGQCPTKDSCHAAGGVSLAMGRLMRN